MTFTIRLYTNPSKPLDPQGVKNYPSTTNPLDLPVLENNISVINPMPLSELELLDEFLSQEFDEYPSI